jgi:hypothetical protein
VAESLDLCYALRELSRTVLGDGGGPLRGVLERRWYNKKAWAANDRFRTCLALEAELDGNGNRNWNGLMMNKVSGPKEAFPPTSQYMICEIYFRWPDS